MQFYNYDFSEWVPLSFAEDGFFAIRPKLEYLSIPTTLPFLILVDAQISGFVIVDDEVHVAGAQHNIGYFFVARRYRGLGVGTRVVRIYCANSPDVGRYSTSGKIWEQLRSGKRLSPLHPAANMSSILSPSTTAMRRRTGSTDEGSLGWVRSLKDIWSITPNCRRYTGLGPLNPANELRQ